MNKLTINQVAFSSFRHRRSDYLAIVLSAGLAIFFISVLFLTIQSVYETYRLAHKSRVGNQDAIIFDSERVMPDLLLKSGLITELGNVYVLGETEKKSCSIGYYDEYGVKMASRTLISGHLPIHTGEIAVEQRFLQMLGINAEIGDTIELALKIPRGIRAEFLPETVEKAYIIVGLLKPQSIFISDDVYSETIYANYPSAIVSANENVDPGGRSIIHRMVRYSDGIDFTQLSNYLENEVSEVLLIQSTRFSLFDWNSHGDQFGNSIMIAVITILGIVLVLSACLGIVNAFSANLSRRHTQIGLMRAVGATSHQIRQIFGREALLLALLISPISIGTSYLFVWGIIKSIGLISFHVNTWFLPAVLFISISCVMMAAWIPLIGISRISPIQAIREINLLHAKRKVKIHSHYQYNAPRLIAKRHLTLYRTRQVSVAVIITFSMLIISMGVTVLQSFWNQSTLYGYQIVGFRMVQDEFLETYMNAHEGLTEKDIDEVFSLPLVSNVDITAHVQTNLLMDYVTPYVANLSNNIYWKSADEALDEENLINYRALKAEWKIAQEVMPTSLYTYNESILNALNPYVLEGRINTAALDAGTEVLVIAPEEYYKYTQYNDYGYYSTNVTYTPVRWRNDAIRYTNDTFFTGDKLQILRLFSRGGLTKVDGEPQDYLNGVQRNDATVSIGAVLGKEAFDFLCNLGVFLDNISLVTTKAGLYEIGFESAGYQSLGVQFAEAPDDATENYLTDTLMGIAARGTNMSLRNNLQLDKDAKFWQGIIQSCLLVLLLLMISMCVSLVNHAITNRIRSEKRTVGTLRAVGATLNDIVYSYQLQALTMIGWGLMIGAFLDSGLFLWIYWMNFLPTNLSLNTILTNTVITLTVFLMAIVLLCGGSLKTQLKELTRESIISNLREF